MELEREQQTYDRELPNLLAHVGKFVLIREDQVVDVYDTYADALKVGYERFKLEPFMVRQIQAADQVLFFSRDIFSCPT